MSWKSVDEGEAVHDFASSLKMMGRRLMMGGFIVQELG